MTKLLASCLVVLASAAHAATPLENAATLVERLGGAPVAFPAAASIATPASAPVARRARVALPAAPAGAYTITALAGKSGSVSGSANATGNGSMNCSGGMMSGWINMTANVSVTTDDGATAQFPVNGTVYLSGSCRGGGGFVNGNAYLNGSGSLYKAGAYVGSASLSGNVFVNQYVNSPFAWINQSVYLTGTYSESSAAAR